MLKSKKLRLALVGMAVLFVGWLCTPLSAVLSAGYSSLAAAVCALVTAYLGSNVGASFAHAKIIQSEIPEVAAPLVPSTVTILTGEKKD